MTLMTYCSEKRRANSITCFLVTNCTPRSTRTQNKALSNIDRRRRHRLLGIYPRKVTCSFDLPANTIEKCGLQGLPTKLSEIQFRGRTIFIKRDDELHFNGVTGSKVRKFHRLINDRNMENFDCVISYGGAQSNAMLALASLCHYRQIPFVYITRPVPKHIFTSEGNFQHALSLNMCHIEIDLDLFRQYFTDLPPDSICQDAYSILKDNYSASISHIPFENPYFIPQGGAWQGAEYGVSILADELRTQITELREEGKICLKKPLLFLPCGTGTVHFPDLHDSFCMYSRKHNINPSPE